MQHIKLGFLIAFISALMTGCSLNPSAEELALMKQNAAMPEIIIEEPMLVYKKGSEDKVIVRLRAGTYTPAREFRNGYIFMLESKYVDVPRGSEEFRGAIGGIYWVHGEKYPRYATYYQSEFVPTLFETETLKEKFNIQK